TRFVRRRELKRAAFDNQVEHRACGRQTRIRRLALVSLRRERLRFQGGRGQTIHRKMPHNANTNPHSPVLRFWELIYLSPTKAYSCANNSLPEPHITPFQRQQVHPENE